MGGGLMQLVAYGAQDVYITGNPQITLFKVVYRRHTNFSSECVELSIETVKPSGRATVPVLRNADLAGPAHFRCTVPDLTPSNSAYEGKVAWVRRLGHAMIKSAEVQIGGSMIDRQYGVWLDIWYELTHCVGQERGYSAMVGDVPELTTLADSVAGGYVMFTPLQFWFCRNYGLALPLIALQYHEVRVNLEFERIENLVCYTRGTGSETVPKFNGLAFGSSGLLVDYIYLDSEERRRFAQVGHEYLIEQVQLNEQNLQNQSENQQFTLNFNHPCKELVWTHRCGAFNGANDASFLAYSNKDSAESWADALQVAAENLATSMIALNGTTPTSGNVVSVTASLTDPVFTDTTVNRAIEPAVMRFTAVNPPTAASGVSGVFKVVTNPLTLTVGSTVTNLATKLGVVSVDLYFGGSNELTNISVSVSGHSLTLDDLSIPISKMTDNRVTANDQDADDVRVVQLSNYGLRLDGKGNMVTEGNIILNGHDRFAKREGNYFNYVQPNRHHSRTPADGINVYSFGLHPEQHQPTGTMNASRIDSARLVYKVKDVLAAVRKGVFDIFTGTTVYIFVTNYNVLRIMSGMGGLAYSN